MVTLFFTHEAELYIRFKKKTHTLSIFSKNIDGKKNYLTIEFRENFALVEIHTQFDSLLILVRPVFFPDAVVCLAHEVLLRSFFDIIINFHSNEHGLRTVRAL